MFKNKVFVYALGLGLLIVLATLAPYYFFVGSWLEFSSSAQNWGLFGDYFGGVAGTLLSFISAIILAATLYFQYKQISNNQEQILKQDLLFQLTKIDDEVENWLDRKLSSNSTITSLVEFRDIVFGVVSITDSFVRDTEFKSAMERLLKLTCSYISALQLYESNIDTHFVYRHYKSKAQELVDFLNKNRKYLNNMAPVSLGFCMAYLDGTLEVSEEDDDDDE